MLRPLLSTLALVKLLRVCEWQHAKVGKVIPANFVN